MKRISPEALSYTDELLAKMRGVASVTSAHLEAWWSTKHRVRRVELFRLLNDLADDERVVKLPGHRWGLPGAWCLWSGRARGAVAASPAGTHASQDARGARRQVEAHPVQGQGRRARSAQPRHRRQQDPQDRCSVDPSAPT